jgi:hypothetical protein
MTDTTTDSHIDGHIEDPSGTVDMGRTAPEHFSQGLQVQTYSLGVLKQPDVNLGSFANLKGIEGKMNTALGNARSNAKSYLDNCLPLSIKTLADIQSYFDVQDALAELLDAKDVDQSIELANATCATAKGYKDNANVVVTKLINLRDGFSHDAREFTSFKSQLNSVVSEDDVVLASLDGQLAEIDKKIGIAIAGAITSGFVTAGGLFIIAVGAIPAFITAGTSTPLVLIGVGITAAGVAGAVGSGVAIGVLASQKSALMQQQVSLKDEVKFPSGLQTTFDGLSNGAGASAGACQGMANSWGLLSSHLEKFIEDVTKARTADEKAMQISKTRNLFLSVAQKDVVRIQEDLKRISGALAGTGNYSGGTTLEEALKLAQHHVIEKARAPSLSMMVGMASTASMASTANMAGMTLRRAALPIPGVSPKRARALEIMRGIGVDVRSF